MATVKNILVPIDFSSNSRNALRYAIQFSAKANCKLTLFYANYLPTILPSVELKKIESQSDERKKRMMEYTVDKICKTKNIPFPKNISYIVKREKDIVKNILNSAEECSADMIVMGTHGETSFKKALLGSNTNGVINKSPIPVLAIPAHYRYKDIETIIYASDLKNVEEELNLLLPIAKTYEATVHILHLDYWNKGIDFNTQKSVNELLKKSRYKKTHLIEKDVTIKNTMSEHLQKYVQQQKAPILVMFPEKQNFFEKLFLGSITESIAAHIKHPLLSIRRK